jgi:hypothetical protein
VTIPPSPSVTTPFGDNSSAELSVTSLSASVTGLAQNFTATNGHTYIVKYAMGGNSANTQTLNGQVSITGCAASNDVAPQLTANTPTSAISPTSWVVGQTLNCVWSASTGTTHLSIGVNNAPVGSIFYIFNPCLQDLASPGACVTTNTTVEGPTYGLSSNGILFPQILQGTTGTITGTSLSASCDSGTVTVSGATVGRPVIVSSTTGADVGGAFNVRGSVTSANTVTVYVCGTGTPSSLAYNVDVL